MKANKYTLGWSDIELFFDFRKRALCCQSGIFLLDESNYKNIGEFGRSRAAIARQSFYFQKITRTLKMNIFWKICINLPLTAKKNRQKENSRSNFLSFLFYFKLAKWVLI